MLLRANLPLIQPSYSFRWRPGNVGSLTFITCLVKVHNVLEDYGWSNFFDRLFNIHILRSSYGNGWVKIFLFSLLIAHCG